MIAQAKARFVRLTPTKVRQVINLIRGRDVPASLDMLMHINKRAKEMVTKVLRSAVSSAQQKGLAQDQLYISKIIADPGPMWKRFRAASFGRATPILKRTTHLTIELDVKTK